MGSSGTYSGPSTFVLAAKGAVVNLPGASVGANIPSTPGGIITA
jgi:hypothetical protein